MTHRSMILFVEDESDLRDLVSEVLSAKGFEVLLASDGYEAVRLLTEHHVDLLLTDIVMPGISGFELARQAKLMRPTLLRKPVRAVDLLNMIECKMVGGAATGHAPESSCENSPLIASPA